MKFLTLIIVGLFFVSCKEGTDSSRDKDVEDILNDGNWRLIESEKSFDRFQNGLKFSEDNQVFNIDSQGQVVVPMHERLFSISGDTLTFIDYRYEERFIYSRGTDILLIEEITSDRLVLNVIHPEGPNKLILESIH
ncbi:hypothetical protein ERX46_12625 [Brumimicrobium glaciale]|uniref:Lipocalin-like domain-containing protein n=1 Tax=Brumimicrobium glaciale TaxID=200475 RepID=A0A4Q4KIB1_9FLAO|nr:hypothetical protein [Brumimicrobium glaciale]RYM32895.1 hypothetical protein ERX46_12625 [Brumimicrobium glaciale]